MKLQGVLGLVLVVVGVIALAYQGITYTKKEKVIDIGPVEIQREEKETIPLPPILGVASLAGGIVLIVLANRSRTER